MRKKLVIALLLLSFARPTHAFIAEITFDPSNFGENLVSTASTLSLELKELVLDGIAWHIAKTFVHMMSQQIIGWIRGEGDPLFVRDWDAFLKDAADQASGRFLEELKLTGLCDPFALRIQMYLKQPSFLSRARCTITDVVRNFDNFGRDFSQGGWKRWFEVTQVPQNNFFGAYYISLEENLRRQASAVTASQNEALSAQGFIGVKQCDKPVASEQLTAPMSSVDESATSMSSEEGYETVSPMDVQSNCKIVTPGKAVEDALSSTIGAPIDQLNIADEIDEILSAALDQMMQSLLYGRGGLFSSDLGPSNRAARDDLRFLKQSLQERINPESVRQQLGDVITLKENSLVKAKTLLTTLESVKACQISKNSSSDTISETNADMNAASSTIKALTKEIEDQKNFRDDISNIFYDLDAATSVTEVAVISRRIEMVMGEIERPNATKGENEDLRIKIRLATAALQDCQR